MAYDLAAALLSLRPGAKWALNGDTYDGLDWRDTRQSAPSLAECEVEMTRLKAAWDAQNYARLRKAAYPKIEEQLDMLYHQGYDGWRDAIQAIKDQYPKTDNN